MGIKISEQRQKILDFVKKHSLGVLATSNSIGFPHAAAVYFVFDDELNIYFVTKEMTIKHSNLKSNPLASIAIYDAATQTTLQASGKAKVVDDFEKFMEIYKKIDQYSNHTTGSERLPVSKLFAGDYFMYCIKPQSLRLAEYTKPEKGDYDIFQVVH